MKTHGTPQSLPAPALTQEEGDAPRTAGPLAWCALALIRLYRLFLSPYLGGRCRFYPSCSHYAQEAVSRFGAARGAALGALRILRCNPLCESGYDPVPKDGRLRLHRSSEVPRDPGGPGSER